MPAAFRIPDAKSSIKNLTGQDAPVIDYLNQQESVHQFLASVMSMVDASVSEYQRRGFKNLMVSFGCTGGQHRSVYFAEQLAKRCEAGADWKYRCGISLWRNGPSRNSP